MTIDAWTVLDTEDKNRLAPWGNGQQYQYPIFPNRAELRDWKKRHIYHKGQWKEAKIKITWT